MRILYAEREVDIIFNFKSNAATIKIFLFLTVIAFFMPFFSVSCSNNTDDGGVSFSGFELSAGKYVGGYRQDGHFLGFMLLVPPAVLLILTFLICEIKNPAFHNILKYISFIVPIFDIFAAFMIKFAFNAVLLKIMRDRNLEQLPVRISIKSGFLLYILFNIVVCVFAVTNYFTKRE